MTQQAGTAYGRGSMSTMRSRMRSIGTAQAEAFLARFGGEQIVHGHTPITKITGQPPEAVREPLFYADGLCIDVDPGMYLGGPGFVYPLDEGDGPASA